MFKKGITAVLAFATMTTAFGGTVALMTTGAPIQAEAALKA